MNRYELTQEIDGNTYGHEIYARTDEEAEAIAEKNGWRYASRINDFIYVCEICQEEIETPSDAPIYNQ